MDHLAILTELDLPTYLPVNTKPHTPPDWSKTDWDKYWSTISPRLTPALFLLATNPAGDQVDSIAELITMAFDKTIKALNPLLKIGQRSRRWWCAETLNPLNGHAMNLRRRAQHSGELSDNVLYQAAQHKYQQLCKDAKINHWHAYLAQLSAKDLFTAAGYTNGPPAPRTLPPLTRHNGSLTSNPEEQANLLFEATGGPTVVCDLTEVPLLPSATGWNPTFTTDHILDSTGKLKLGKAPGSDGITNLAVAP